MITQSSIQYISQMLDNPQNLSDADTDSIQQLTQSYPYFVPARYMEAALRQKQQPFSQEMMSSMQLYKGNWINYSNYLLTANDADYTTPVAAPQPQVAPTQEQPVAIVEEEIVEEVVETIEQEDNIDKIEEQFESIGTEAPEQEQEFVPKNTGFVTGAHTPRPATEQVQEEAPAPKQSEQQRYTSNDTRDNNLIPPIYTEDYFLHQGMHVSNAIPGELDKSDQQFAMQDDEKSLMVVMSFSEWLSYYKKKKQQEQEEEEDQKTLKTMWQKEKLAAALEEENDEIPENVFEMAVNSISKEEGLISESLAEVHVKQGRYEKAIDMYKKLSLRKPQKKAYFARKIEEILKEK
ncbi:MAG: hypothetical protein H6551_06765 [Chitinophagales bacterium]|nr:hypothetical protein [Chitinophagaceae bacterium]MCB9064832.1 hypothetical protein [Chitinophagales bacterium]